MNICLFLGAVVFFTLAFAHHEEGHHEHDKGENHESSACHKIAPYNSKFAFDLYHQVAQDHPDKNMVFSPTSISTAFAFLALAAKGQTHSQIMEGLRFNTSEISEQEIHDGFHHLLDLLNDAERELKFSGGNALFISKDHTILQTFLDEAKRLYHSEVFSTDFKNKEEAKYQINSYVRKNTHGKIAELLDSVDQDAIFVLINYIYFRGEWEHPFEEKWTNEGDFHVNKNKTVKVPFMSRTGMYLVSYNDDATVVSIPYKGDAGALFILPNEGKFTEVEQNFQKESIMKWKNAMQRRNMRIPLFLGAVVFFTFVFAHHEEGHHEHKDDHHGKHGHRDKREHHDHLHHNEFLACHKIAPYTSKFAFDLYHLIARDHPNENIVLSPISISTAFAFLALAAKAQTLSQIMEGFSFNTSEISEQEIHEGFHHLLVLLSDAERELKFSSGNALFISEEHKILQTFLDEAKRLYHSEAFTTDFKNTAEAKKQINSYVKKNTHGKIAELLDSVDPDAIFVLINYIYFRGEWEHPFEENQTKEGDFHVNKNTTVKVPFMSRTGMYLASVNDDATMVSIPYKGDVEALFILPNVGKFTEVEQNFQKESIMKWKNAMQRRSVDLFVPKFSVSGTINLKETLSKMGVVDVFSDSADLSNITGEANTKISKAVHRAVFRVDEKETEAAGPAALEAIPAIPPPSIHFNRPFMFTVYDNKSQNILFTGRIVNPQT